MKLITFIAAILLSVILIFKFPRTIEVYQVSQSGEKVIVTIQRLPDCSSGYKNKFISITYNNQIFVLRTKCKYVQKLSERQQLLMLHKPGTDIFLFPEENAGLELIAVILITIAIILCLMFSFRLFKSKSL